MPVEAPPAAPVAPPSSGSATVTQVDIVEAPTPPPPKTPPGEVHLEHGPITEVKKGSAMERMQAELAKRAKPQFFEQAPESTPPEKPAQSQQPDSPKSGPPPEGESQDHGKPSSEAPPSSQPE